MHLGIDGPFGIVVAPKPGRRRTGVIMLNSGLLHRVGPSRLYVSLSRELACQRFVVARIDVSGKGDSVRRSNLTAEQSLLADFDHSCAALNELFKLDTFILIGLCSGADDAFNVASVRANVSGLVLLDGYAARTLRYYCNHYLSRLFQAEPWMGLPKRLAQRVNRLRGLAVSDDDLTMREIRAFPDARQAREKLSQIATHCESCLCVYTSASKSYYNYQGQLAAKFPTFRPARGLVELFLPAAKHTYPLAHHRRLVMDRIREWAEKFS